ncbi:CHAD domain-containing protein [Streptomyces sp. S.PB5]|uniref:CHAD domain-containing protein n=1 Tax=Streptomyces sp. S.PB5 TaxID=3020844 RepID=UPI0025AFF30A|nr:CHAD domain-containing protein [Streptomyces sp. S.PB5]MDN3028796.1 CHAD domain-containing protein [Streptomyces sp. S.PB5]
MAGAGGAADADGATGAGGTAGAGSTTDADSTAGPGGTAGAGSTTGTGGTAVTGSAGGTTGHGSTAGAGGTTDAAGAGSTTGGTPGAGHVAASAGAHGTAAAGAAEAGSRTADATGAGSTPASAGTAGTTSADSAGGASGAAGPVGTAGPGTSGTVGAGAAGRGDAHRSATPGRRTDAAAAAPGHRAVRATAEPKKAAPGGSSTYPAPTSTPDRGNLTVGAAKAGALLDRQLTLARTRAHSTALQALGSSRFHAVADHIAVLASEVPLVPMAATADLHPYAQAAEDRLKDAVAALPLVTAGHPYNAEALIHGLSPDPSPHPQDAPWHQVRLLLRLHRYAREVLYGEYGESVDVRLLAAGEALDRHRDASEAAAAAAQAARTPRIAPATAYALGVLHADQRHEVEAARFAFQRAWQMETVRTS